MRDALIIEDDQHKLDDFCGLLTHLHPKILIASAKSVQEAIEKLDLQKFDLVVLDMALPSHDLLPGMGSPMSLLSGGMEIVYEFDHQERLEPVIIVTQHPEIEIDSELIKIGRARRELLERYKVNLLDCIHYEVGGLSWKEKFRKAIQNL